MQPGMQDMMKPLSKEELEQLDMFLLELDAEENMTLEMLYGYR